MILTKSFLVWCNRSIPDVFVDIDVDPSLNKTFVKNQYKKLPFIKPMQNDQYKVSIARAGQLAPHNTMGCLIRTTPTKESAMILTKSFLVWCNKTIPEVFVDIDVDPSLNKTFVDRGLKTGYTDKEKLFLEFYVGVEKKSRSQIKYNFGRLWPSRRSDGALSTMISKERKKVRTPIQLDDVKKKFKKVFKDHKFIERWDVELKKVDILYQCKFSS